MYDKRRTLTFSGMLSVACLGIFLTGCATAGPVTSKTIHADMISIKHDLAGGRNAASILKNKRVGNTGFYYIVDADGIVVFHPQSALIGSNFKNHWFINKILADRSGCLSYRLGNRTHVVFFDQLNENEILCFSIITDDLPGMPPECVQSEIR